MNIIKNTGNIIKTKFINSGQSLKTNFIKHQKKIIISIIVTYLYDIIKAFRLISGQTFFYKNHYLVQRFILFRIILKITGLIIYFFTQVYFVFNKAKLYNRKNKNDLTCPLGQDGKRPVTQMYSNAFIGVMKKTMKERREKDGDEAFVAAPNHPVDFGTIKGQLKVSSDLGGIFENGNNFDVVMRFTSVELERHPSNKEHPLLGAAMKIFLKEKYADKERMKKVNKGLFVDMVNQDIMLMSTRNFPFKNLIDFVSAARDGRPQSDSNLYYFLSLVLGNTEPEHPIKTWTSGVPMKIKDDFYMLYFYPKKKYKAKFTGEETIRKNLQYILDNEDIEFDVKVHKRKNKLFYPLDNAAKKWPVLFNRPKIIGTLKFPKGQKLLDEYSKHITFDPHTGIKENTLVNNCLDKSRMKVYQEIQDKRRNENLNTFYKHHNLWPPGIEQELKKIAETSSLTGNALHEALKDKFFELIKEPEYKITARDNTWTIKFNENYYNTIKEYEGVVVSQGSSKGNLKKSLFGDSKLMLVQAEHDVIFNENENLIVGSTEVTKNSIDEVSNTSLTDNREHSEKPTDILKFLHIQFPYKYNWGGQSITPP